MSWMAQDVTTRLPSAVDQAKTDDYEKAKADGLPVIEKEAEGGVKPIEPLRFQPVRSPKIYEAEFAVKGKDLIFHFWPDGYHDAERDGRAKPALKPHFIHNLLETMADVFGSGRIKLEEDRDVGAIFVQVFGWGENDSYRQIAIEACEKFHKAMGGSEG